MRAQAFILRYREALKARVTGLSYEAREAVRAYAWPGNVRELENRIKRAVIMAKGPALQPADLELPSSGPAKPPVTLKEAQARGQEEFMPQGPATPTWH